MTLVLVGALAVLGLGVTLSFLFPDEPTEPHQHGLSGFTGEGAPAPPCPFGYVDRVGQEARIRAALESDASGRALIAELEGTRMRFCFADRGPGYVTEERVILLNSRLEGPELFARAAHLMSHVARGLPMPSTIDGDADCQALLERAVTREAEAYVLEVTLRESLGVEAPRYEFEEATLRAAPDAREALVEAYLREHPEGGPNLEGLIAGYSARCAEATGSAPQ